MQPTISYEDEYRKRFQNEQDPFKLGQNVAARRYSEMLQANDIRNSALQQQFGRETTQFDRAGIRNRASGMPSFSGGMGQQYRDYTSAAEMDARSGAMQRANMAFSDLALQRQAAGSNAALEGQQATQMQLQNQQTQYQLYQQRQAILNDSSLSTEEKQAQLQMLGQPMTSAELGSAQTSATTGSIMGGVAAITVPTGIAAVRAGASNFAAANATATAATARATTRAAREAGVAAAKAAKAANPLRANASAAAKAARAAKIKDAYTAAYKATSIKTVAPQYNMAGKVYAKVIGGSGWKALGKAALKWGGRLLTVYSVIAGIEMIAEAAGVADGRGFSGLITKEGSGWDKFFEGIGW